MTYADIVTNMTEAVTALGNGDYALARDKALAAQALLSVLPDTSRSTGGAGSQGMTWDRVAVSTFLDRVQRVANSASGVQVSKVQVNSVTGFDSHLGCY